MKKLTAILVDDEQDSREILSRYLEKYCPNVDLKAKCEGVKTALKAIKEFQPQIVFLDIEMPYGNGFDLLDQVEEVNFETVFVTAYDNYAIKALNQSAAYYLLKPIDIDELVAAVDKITKSVEAEDPVIHAKVLLDNLKSDGKPKRLMLPTMEGFEIVAVDDIIYCEADDNFTRFYLTNNREYLICRTLKYFEESLSEESFVRIHRSHMINLQFVTRYTRGKGGYVTMSNDKELEVAPKKKAVFLESFMK